MGRAVTGAATAFLPGRAPGQPPPQRRGRSGLATAVDLSSHWWLAAAISTARLSPLAATRWPQRRQVATNNRPLGSRPIVMFPDSDMPGEMADPALPRAANLRHGEHAPARVAAGTMGAPIAGKPVRQLAPSHQESIRCPGIRPRVRAAPSGAGRVATSSPPFRSLIQAATDLPDTSK